MTSSPFCNFFLTLAHKNQNQTAKMMMRFVSPLLLAVGLLALTTTHHVASAASPSEVIIRNGRRMGPMGRNRNRGNPSNNNLGSRIMTAEAKASASRNAAAKARKEQTQRRRRLTAAVVANGSFEGSAVSSDWSSVSPLSSADGASSSSGGYTLSNANARTGTQSIQVTDGGARQTVTLPPGAGHSGSTITFGGYSKAISTGTGLFNDYAILADVTFTDGTTLFGEAAQFRGGTTTGWVMETHAFDVPNGKTVQSIDLSVLYRNDPTDHGVVYFDDIFVNVDNTKGALANPGFEGNLRSAGWKPYMGGYAVDTTTYHSGGQSIKVTSGGASQWIYPSNAVAGSQMKFSGYAKSDGASSIHGGPAVMSVYVDVKYFDGSWLLGQEAEFAGGRTDGWEYAENTIPLAKDVEAIHVRAVYYGDVQAGVAWFDDFNVEISNGVVSAS